MSKIEWTDRSDWNPVRGCTRVSEGCQHCYAEVIAARFSDPGQPFHGFAKRTSGGPRWTGKVELIEERLTLPLKWRKPARIFVNSAFDLFHESIPDAWIDRVFAVMALSPQHIFQVLTKRSNRMQKYCADPETTLRVWDEVDKLIERWDEGFLRVRLYGIDDSPLVYALSKQGAKWNGKYPWPLRHVWLGVSAEDQARADERIPDLLATPAAARFVSAEPLLGTIRFREVLGDDWLASGKSGERKGLDWVIVGSESGKGARPCDLAWVKSIKDQCVAAGVPFFWKQHVENGRKIATPEMDGRKWTEFPGGDE